LAGRISEEVEERNILLVNQIGFRKGMGTMDNIYIYTLYTYINYLIKQTAGKEGEEMEEC